MMSSYWVTTDRGSETRLLGRHPLSAVSSLDAMTHAGKGESIRAEGPMRKSVHFCFSMNIDRQVHFHILPRYKGRREFAGGTFVDPEFGGHYGIGPARTLDPVAYDAV